MTWTGRLQEADGLFFDGEMVCWRQSGLPEERKKSGRRADGDLERDQA